MLNLIDVTKTGKVICEIDGKYYRLIFWKNGEWYADQVERDQYGRWVTCDDDVWIIRGDKIVRRMIGWDKREESYD